MPSELCSGPSTVVGIGQAEAAGTVSASQGLTQ